MNLQELQNPEYVHVLLNPLPVYGVALGALALAIALALKSGPARSVALILVFLCAASAWPVEHFGEEAYDDLKPMLDKTSLQWLDAHMDRAEDTLFVFYGVAALALASLLAPRKWPRSATPLAAVTLAAAVIAVGIGGWIAYAGGKVRHDEFRNAKTPPPEHPAQNEHHEH